MFNLIPSKCHWKQSWKRCIKLFALLIIISQQACIICQTILKKQKGFTALVITGVDRASSLKIKAFCWIIEEYAPHPKE